MGDKLRQARLAAGMTQVELAEAVGCHQKDISRWERGTHEPVASALRRMADALGCKVDDLV